MQLLRQVNIRLSKDVYQHLEAELARERAELARLRAEIARLERQRSDIAELQAALTKLQQSQVESQVVALPKNAERRFDISNLLVGLCATVLALCGLIVMSVTLYFTVKHSPSATIPQDLWALLERIIRMVIRQKDHLVGWGHLVQDDGNLVFYKFLTLIVVTALCVDVTRSLTKRTFDKPRTRVLA